ncbi:hypothetical protein TNCV_1580861 [Trichonephila clavipes]|nr:hypothetical protein TNCV_1580861 [Trichonephila clavipes]
MNFFYSKDNLVALHFKYDQARRRFVEWAQNDIAVVPDFHTRILFSDEAHFWLNGYVNKQNCRIWSEANPQVTTFAVLLPIYGHKCWKNDSKSSKIGCPYGTTSVLASRSVSYLLNISSGVPDELSLQMPSRNPI